MKQYNDLFTAADTFKKPKERYYYIFSKGGFNASVQEQAAKDGVKLLGLKELFAN